MNLRSAWVGAGLMLAACGGGEPPAPEIIRVPDPPVPPAERPVTPEQQQALEIALATVTSVPGEYIGMLPCSDCQGVETELNVIADRTFQLKETYVGRAPTIYVTNGTWGIGTLEFQLVLTPERGERRFFEIVGPDELESLNRYGLPINNPATDISLRRKQIP